METKPAATIHLNERGFTGYETLASFGKLAAINKFKLWCDYVLVVRIMLSNPPGR